MLRRLALTVYRTESLERSKRIVRQVCHHHRGGQAGRSVNCDRIVWTKRKERCGLCAKTNKHSVTLSAAERPEEAPPAISSYRM